MLDSDLFPQGRFPHNFQSSEYPITFNDHFIVQVISVFGRNSYLLLSPESDGLAGAYVQAVPTANAVASQYFGVIVDGNKGLHLANLHTFPTGRAFLGVDFGIEV